MAWMYTFAACQHHPLPSQGSWQPTPTSKFAARGGGRKEEWPLPDDIQAFPTHDPDAKFCLRQFALEIDV